MSAPRSEVYRGYEGERELALRLHREGLLAAINVLVLHPLGLAIGVEARADTMEGVGLAREVSGLTLEETDDSEGWSFSPDAIERIVVKLRAAGHDGLAQAVADAAASDR